MGGACEACFALCVDGPELEGPLKYFLAVCAYGSFSRAAKAIHVSQPALSVSIRGLEERIGEALLHRDSRGASPTRAGEVLRDHALQARRQLDAARQEIDALSGELRGRYTLGVHESLGTYFLPGFMSRFLGDHGHVQLSLLNAPSTNVEEAVLRRDADVGLVVNPSHHPETVVQPLFHDVVTLVVAPSLRARFDSPLALLSTMPLFLLPDIAQTRTILRAMGEAGIAAPQTVACSSMELAKSLVLDATGPGILPWRVATHGVQADAIAKLDDALPRYEDTIALVRRADVPMTRALRALLDALKARGDALATDA